MGGLAAHIQKGGFVHALFCVKVNEITQGVGAAAAGVLSNQPQTEARSSEKKEKTCSWIVKYTCLFSFFLFFFGCKRI